MSEKSGFATTAGIIMGILFIVIAMIPNSHAYPLIVPFLGGVLATYLASRASSLSIGDGARLGAKAGAIGGLIFVLIGAPLVYALVGPVIKDQLRAAGINLPFEGFLALLLGLFIVAIIGLVLAIIGGIIAALVFRRR